jgi:peroxiredoxin Q/BCP
MAKMLKKTVTERAKTARSAARPKNIDTTPFPGMPRVGSLAPDFTLPDQDGTLVTLSAIKAPVVLYFYPKDDTPGCTIEAKGFSADYAAFKKKGVRVYGVSKDTLKSHCAFRDKYGLSFPLLSDEKGAVVAGFGCWVEKSMYGKKYMGIQRATFVIGKDRKVTHVFPKVTPEGHSEELLKIFS